MTLYELDETFIDKKIIDVLVKRIIELEDREKIHLELYKALKRSLELKSE